MALGSATAILGAIFAPAAVVPAVLQAGLNARISRIQQERMEEARETIGEKLEHLDKAKIDAPFVESDAFFDWLFANFDHIRRAQDKAQREALSNTFLNGVTVGKSSSPVKEIVLRWLGEMSHHDVRMLRALEKVARQRPLAGSDGQVGGRSFAIHSELRAELNDLSDFEFDTLVADLSSMDILGSAYEPGTIGAMGWTGQRGEYAFTRFGSAMLEYIRDPGRDD